MNLLYITHKQRFKNFARAGVIAEYMVKRGHRVTMVVTADTERLKIKENMENGVHYVEIPDLLWGRLRSGWDPWNALVKIWYLGQQNAIFDLVHIFETRPSTIFPTLHFLKKKPAPLVADWVDWWGGKEGVISVLRPYWYRITLGHVEEFFEEHFRTRVHGTTVITSALRDRAISLGVNPESILVLPGGTKPEVFPSLAQLVCRSQVPLDLSSPLLGFASFDSHLDLDLILQALKIVRGQYSRIKLLVTGRPSNALRQKIIVDELEENVIFTGLVPLDQLMLYLGCCDVCLLPLAAKDYNRGRWPNKLTDYMLAGRPVVANPIGDVEQVVRDNEIGLLAKWDPQDFANKVMFLIDHPDFANKLGDNARHLAEGEFAWMNLSSKLESFYQKVIGINQMGYG
jgi:glycosyltransferase involved in cell wall biosynthesis